MLIINYRNCFWLVVFLKGKEGFLDFWLFLYSVFVINLSNCFRVAVILKQQKILSFSSFFRIARFSSVFLIAFE